MRTLLVYADDSPFPAELNAIVGGSRFGDIVFRRRKLADRIVSLAAQLGMEVLTLMRPEDRRGISDVIQAKGISRVIHVSSRLAPAHEEAILDRLKRVQLVSDACRGTLKDTPCEFFAADAFHYLRLLQQVESGGDAFGAGGNIPVINLPIDGAFLEISSVVGLIDFLSGAFTSRQFNNVARTDRWVVKSSRNIAKIKSEYNFVHQLPESMRYWFLTPFDLKVTADQASYQMERMLVLDMGQQWINGSITVQDFGQFTEDVFNFLDERVKRPCSRQRAEAHFDQLYVDKMRARRRDMEGTELLSSLNAMLRAGTAFSSLDELIALYFDLLMPFRAELPDHETVSHGDACFSNMLYDKRIRLLKLIDPRGATTVDDLYLDPHYDLAKLSHSALGGYDFLVNRVYDVVVDETLKMHLVTPEPIFDECATLFIDALVQRQLDVRRIRLYEASLFISMLPLHRDEPRNVLAFVLAAAATLDEVRSQ